MHKYPVDLVNQEGMDGSHVIDKHVAKTDVVDVLGEHMRAHHPLRWQPRRPRPTGGAGGAGGAAA